MKFIAPALALIIAVVAPMNLVQAAPFSVPESLHVRGDMSDKEILRYRRIRVERQEVLYDDTRPMICKLGSTVLVAGQKGSLARTKDGGLHWETLDNIIESGSTGKLEALGALSGGKVLAAIQKGSRVTILSSADQGQTWKTSGKLTAPSQDEALRGRFVQLADKSVLLSLASVVFRSTDNGTNWSQHATLSKGLSALRPVVLRSGRLLASALYKGDTNQGYQHDYRNTVITESTDGGKSWKILAAATRIGQVPGDLVELSDGRLVLSYGEESFPHGARALISDDGGKTWGEETYVLGQSRYGLRLEPRPEACEPASGIGTVVLDDGVIISVYDRGKTLKRHQEPIGERIIDEWGHVPAVNAIRWTPEGFERPPLVYPNLLTTTVDHEGFLDNGLVRMKPEHRFEGGDYIENYETIVYRRLPGERYFCGDGVGSKGVIVCRHPDGSLVFTSRVPEIYRSTDEGRTWTKIADIDRPPSHDSSTSGFGVTKDGTYLAMVDLRTALADKATGARPQYKMHIGRSTDGGKTWDFKQIAPGPKIFGGRGDGSRINQLSDGTIILNTATAWVTPQREVNLGEVIMRSKDDGQTWYDFTVLPPDTCESNLLELPGGRLLLATRFQNMGEKKDHYFGQDLGEDDKWEYPSPNYVGHGRFKNEAIMLSNDGGYNWTKPFIVTRIHMVSADVVLDPEGRVVLSYDHKDSVGGCRARVSTDGGLTWEEENYILAYDRIGTRTSSVVLKDGRVLTLWASGISKGVSGTIWKPE